MYQPGNYQNPNIGPTQKPVALRSFFNFNFRDDDSNFSFGTTEDGLQYTPIRKSPKYGAAAARQVNQMFRARKTKKAIPRKSVEVPVQDSDSSLSSSDCESSGSAKKRQSSVSAGVRKKLKASKSSLSSSDSSLTTTRSRSESQKKCWEPTSRRKPKRPHVRSIRQDQGSSKGCCHGDDGCRPKSSRRKPSCGPLRRADGSISEICLMKFPCQFSANECDLNNVFVTEDLANLIQKRIKNAIYQKMQGSSH